MKQSRFSELQIVAILTVQQAGMAMRDVCRGHGMSTATFYKRRARFGRLEVAKAKRLRQLGNENSKRESLAALSGAT